MKTIITLILTLFLFAGCATTQTEPLDTLDKRLVLMESTYLEVLKMGNKYRAAGLLTEGEVARVDEVIDELTRARNAAHTAANIGNTILADQSADAFSAANKALRAVLMEVIKDGSN